MVEYQGGRQLHTGQRTQLVAQFHGGERVESHVVEGALFVDGTIRGVTEYGRDLLADELDQRALLLVGRHRAELAAECGVRAGDAPLRTVAPFPDQGRARLGQL